MRVGEGILPIRVPSSLPSVARRLFLLPCSLTEQTSRKCDCWDGEQWTEQKEVRVVEEDISDSSAVRWMDYKSRLPDAKDREAVELVIPQRLFTQLTQLDIAIVKEELADAPGTLEPA